MQSLRSLLTLNHFVTLIIYMLELLLLHRVQPPLVQLLTLFASLHAVTPYHPLHPTAFFDCFLYSTYHSSASSTSSGLALET